MTARGYDGSKLDGLIFREILIVPSQPKLSLPRNLDSFPEVKLFLFGQPCHDHKMIGHPAVASTKIFYRNARYIHIWNRDRVSHWLSMVLKLRGLWDLGDHLMLINELCFKYFLHLIAWCTRPLNVLWRVPNYRDACTLCAHKYFVQLFWSQYFAFLVWLLS